MPPSPSPSAAVPPAWLVIEGEGVGKEELPLLDGALVLGRAEDCDVVLPDRAVSRHHARLDATDRGWVLTDLGSTTGTVVDGTRIGGPTVLRDGAAIRIGRLRLRLDAAARAAPPPRRPAPAASPDPLVGRTLADFRILRRVGVGATGSVYAARQESLAREVALKVLAPKLAADPKRVESFLKEARAAARLVHPATVVVFDAGRAGEVPWFSMELMEGGSVAELLAASPGGRIPWKTAFPMLQAAARGLAYLHERGVLHRDVKPDNLLIDANGDVKIADLGIALPIAEAKTAPRVGTPAYAAPEVVRGEPPTERSDLYSLGATFHHILTGRTLFEGADKNELLRRVAAGDHPRVIQRASDVPGWLAAAVDKLTEPDPRDRFLGAAQLVDALQLTDVRRQARALGIVARSSGAKGGRRPGRTGAIVAAVAVAAAVAVVWLTRDLGGPSTAGTTARRTETTASAPPAAPSDGAGTPAAVPSLEPGGDDTWTGPGAGGPAERALRRGSAYVHAGRPLDGIDIVLAWARDPARREVRDAQMDEAVRIALDWVRTTAPEHRAAIEAGLLEDQALLAEPYAKAVRAVAEKSPAGDLSVVVAARRRASAIEELIPSLRSDAMRRRGEQLVARLARADVGWRGLVAALAGDSLVGTWDEIRGLPSFPADKGVWISRAVPPDRERIVFEHDADGGRRRVAVPWTELGLEQVAERIVAPYVEKADASLRAEMAAMFLEGGCPKGAAVCLDGLPDDPVVAHLRAELAAVRAFVDLPTYDHDTALAAWAKAHRRSDAFLRLHPDPAASKVLSLDDDLYADFFDPLDSGPR